MLTKSDLDAAAAEGIISKQQALQLSDFAARLGRTGDAALDFSQDTRDEPFRLLKGFRDIFIAIGVVIFAVGLSSVAKEFYNGDWWRTSAPFFQGTYALSDVAIALGLVAAGVLLAEWVTRIQRLPLSSLVLAVVIAFWAAVLSTTLLRYVLPDAAVTRPIDAASLALLPLSGAILGLILFYWRYRLPFALLPLVAAAAWFIYALLQSIFAITHIEGFQRVTIGVLGLMVFALAMWFDLKDRLRVTRFSECAFWLHLLAAPMLVHSLLVGNNVSGISGEPNIAFVLGVMAMLALLALAIDRRALLVSGLSYFAVAIGGIIYRTEIFEGMEFAFTAFIFGVVVLCLGLGWASIRRIIVRLLPFSSLKERLPPVAAK